MAYSDFSLDKVRKQFHTTVTVGSLFPDGQQLPVLPEWLMPTLERGKATATTTEKARSEFIVTPILLAVRELSHNQVALFSGERLTVDRETGLDGECDFIFVATPNGVVIPILDTPVLCLVEAKKNDIEVGLGQCAAQMIGAQKWNIEQGIDHEAIYGCVTTGETWQFLRLDRHNLLTLDNRRYFLNELPLLIAALLAACNL